MVSGSLATATRNVGIIGLFITRYQEHTNKQVMSIINEEVENAAENHQAPEIDSKYRLIIVAAKRSKQLQRGARPRIEIDLLKHKPTRVALEEVIRGRINFTVRHDEKKV